MPTGYRTIRFCDPLLPLVASGFRVFPGRAAAGVSLNNRLHPLSDLGSASESRSRRASSCPLRQERFRGVLCLSARSAVLAPFVCPGSRPRTVPPSGFDCPHGGLRPTPHSPVCFAGTALQGFSLRRLLPLPVRSASRRTAARLAFPALGHATVVAPPGQRCLLGLHPGRDALPRRTPLRVTRRPLLPWVSPPRGHPPLTMATPSRSLPSRASRSRRFRRARCPPRSRS